MDAYLSGLEQRAADSGSLAGIESVASFFVSRVDTEIDRRLEKAGADPSLKGKAALANAQLAYQAYEEVFSSGRWRALEAQGRNIIHLEIGEPDFPTPKHVVEAGKAALDQGFTHYGPTQGLPELRTAIACTWSS